MCIRDRKQDDVRNNLEYGRFDWRGSMSAVQYMERQLLESRQLTPTLTDRQLIRKITRHYGRELEIACVTRDVPTIQNLELLISENAMIRQRNHREDGFVRHGEKLSDRNMRGEPQNQHATVSKVTEPSQRTGNTERVMVVIIDNSKNSVKSRL